MNANNETINFFIGVLTKNDIPASQIYSYLTKACGDDVKSLRRVQEIAKEFRDDVRDDFKRKQGSGRPSTTSNDENVEDIRKAIEEDSGISVRDIANQFDMSVGSAFRIITQKLSLKSVSAKWVPHRLTDNQKLQRVERARQLLDELNGTVIVIDEKWLYAEPLPSKQIARQWVGPAGDCPRSTVARRIIADKKFHIIVALNFRGDHIFHVFERHETVNAHRYVTFLNDVLPMARTGRLRIMHDNARPHTAVLTTNLFEAHGIEHVKQPPYSPDMNLLDRYVFHNLEFSRRNKNFNNKEDVEQYLAEFLNQNMTRYKLSRELDRLKEDLKMIIDLEGDYI